MAKTIIGEGTIILKRGRSEAIRRRHPWIFSGAIYKKNNCTDGGRVRVLDENEAFICKGHYHNGSIAVRILAFEDIPLDHNFWEGRIGQAYKLRQDLDLERANNNAYRLIHGEGDLLPGLIVDVYHETAVIQCHTMAMYNEIDAIAEAIKSILSKIKTIYHKAPNAGDLKEKAGDGFLFGENEKEEIIENGHRFIIDIGEGQKTGFFLDQRENRALLPQLVKDKVFTNLFSYSGGFSVYALKAGAKQVISVDVSEKAIDLANRNVKMNGGGNHEGIAEDVMKYLKSVADQSQDVMVVDPPAFAKSRKRSHNAVQAYKRLNALAISKIKSGGWMMTFSCSQVIGPQLFQDTIRSAAIECGRPVQIVRQLSQGGDHPINIYHPEGHYLKGLLLRIG